VVQLILEQLHGFKLGEDVNWDPVFPGDVLKLFVTTWYLWILFKTICMLCHYDFV